MSRLRILGASSSARVGAAVRSNEATSARVVCMPRAYPKGQADDSPPNRILPAPTKLPGRRPEMEILGPDTLGDRQIKIDITDHHSVSLQAGSGVDVVLAGVQQRLGGNTTDVKTGTTQ